MMETLKIKDVVIELHDAEIILKQNDNVVRVPLDVTDVDGLFNSMKSPSYEELQQERQAHSERLTSYGAALELADSEYKEALSAFAELEQQFFVGKTDVQTLEQGRERLEAAQKKYEQTNATYNKWARLADVTEYDEHSLYDSYRSALTEVDGGNLQELRQARECFDRVTDFISQKVKQQNNHVWDFGQQIQRQAFLPRGHRMTLNGHHLARPTAYNQYGKKQAK